MKRLALAALALIATGTAPAAEPLGRLFFTPEQRDQMDVARAQRSRATLAAEIEEQTPAPEIVRYQGIVRRSDGKSTIWINGSAINDGNESGRLPPARPRSDGSIVLELPQSDRKVNLKVGQSVELLSGTIAEPYARPAAPPKQAPGSGAPETSAAAAPPATQDRDRPPLRNAPARESELAGSANDASRAADRPAR